MQNCDVGTLIRALIVGLHPRRPLEMLAARTERARPARSWFLHLSVLMILGRAFSALGQSAAREHPVPADRPSILPKTCLEQSHPSEKITALLEAIHDHPTAGAYN